jgi:hypothetical protein
MLSKQMEMAKVDESETAVENGQKLLKDMPTATLACLTLQLTAGADEPIKALLVSAAATRDMEFAEIARVRDFALGRLRVCGMLGHDGIAIRGSLDLLDVLPFMGAGEGEKQLVANFRSSVLKDTRPETM